MLNKITSIDGQNKNIINICQKILNKIQKSVALIFNIFIVQSVIKNKLYHFNFMQIQPQRFQETPAMSSFNPLSDFQTNNQRSSITNQTYRISLSFNNLTQIRQNSSMDEKQNDKHITDRFIPMRKNQTISHTNLLDQNNEAPQKPLKRGEEINEQKMTLDTIYKMFVLNQTSKKVLKFNKKVIKSQKDEGMITNDKICGQKYDFRKVSKIPYKVLDAPKIQDDFYLNLLEWSSTNILSVALESCLYFWNGNHNKVLKFCDLSRTLITSQSWNSLGTKLAIGTNLGTTEIWDVSKCKRTETLIGHSSRVSSLDWNNNTILASGSKDNKINIRDIRVNSNQIVKTYQGHVQQVCGLKWSNDGQMLASGGNDNQLLVWNLNSINSTTPVCQFSDHIAAVKGIDWSPHHHGLLASGGGSIDRTIKFWNTSEGKLLDSYDTGSQVCNLKFSKNTKQIVTTHGFSNNQIIIWQYPSLLKTATLTGHSSRVLFLAMSPSGDSIVTGAGDQTLRFWKIFQSNQTKPISNNSDKLTQMQLR